MLLQQFEDAKAASKNLQNKPSNEILLQLYALYKQGSLGNNTDEEPTNPFDFVARAKHTAWAEQKDKTKEAAMEEYIALVNSLK